MDYRFIIVTGGFACLLVHLYICVLVNQTVEPRSK